MHPPSRSYLPMPRLPRSLALLALLVTAFATHPSPQRGSRNEPARLRSHGINLLRCVLLVTAFRLRSRGARSASSQSVEIRNGSSDDRRAMMPMFTLELTNPKKAPRSPPPIRASGGLLATAGPTTFSSGKEHGCLAGRCLARRRGPLVWELSYLVRILLRGRQTPPAAGPGQLGMR